jgi:predicted dehydrogenase
LKFEKKKLGVAVVGLGVGEQHALAYARNEHCEIRWLYDLDQQKAERLATRLSVERTAEIFDQILEDSRTQIISIASFDDAHFEQVVAALNAEKHVFVEKPICRTVQELREIKKAWWQHQGRLKLSSNLVLRAAPIYQWLKLQIEQGVLGEIYSVDGDYLYGRLNKITEGWRKNVENYSVTLGGGVHLIDLMLWITSQRPSVISSVGNRISTEGTEFRYKDYVALTAMFSSGMVGRITSNFGSVHRHQHVLRVFGTKGTFIYDDEGPRLHTSRDPALRANRVHLNTLPSSKGDLIPSFVEGVLTDENLNAHTQQMFDCISVCAASDKALLNNEFIEVQYV